MEKFGIGIIGAGRIAQSSHLPAVSQLKNVELVAVMDIKTELAKEVAKKFGAKTSYSNLEKILKDPEIDGVIICLPHNLHCRTAVEAATYGKHILVEKPMALTVNEAEAMKKAAEENDVTLMTAHVYRFTHSFMWAKKMIEGGTIGRPLHIICERYLHVDKPPVGWWQSLTTCGGLVMTLNGPHHIDIALWLMGSDARFVCAQTLHSNPSWQGEDQAAIQMRLNNGSLATIVLSFNSRQEMNESLIIGSKGTLVIEEYSQLGKSVSQVKINDEIQDIGVPEYDRFALQIKNFVGVSSNELQPAITTEESISVVRVMEAALRSASTNSVIDLTPVKVRGRTD